MTTHQEALEAAFKTLPDDWNCRASHLRCVETAIRAYLSTLAPSDNGLIQRLRGIPPKWVDTRLGNEAADALTASQADRTALAAENERLKARLSTAYRVKAECNDDANSERHARIAAEDRAGSLQTLLDKAVEALEPFAVAGAQVIEERPDAPDAVPFAVMVDEHDNGIITLMWGQLLAARSTLTAIQEARHAGE